MHRVHHHGLNTGATATLAALRTRASDCALCITRKKHVYMYTGRFTGISGILVQSQVDEPELAELLGVQH